MKIEIFAASGCKSCAAAGDALKNVAATVSSNVAWRMVNVLDELDYAVDLGVLSLPSVAVEAMRQAIPVIASTDAGTVGLISAGKNGLIFPSRDASALAASIATMLANPDTALALGAAARATVTARFDAAHQSRALEQILLQATWT